MGGPPFDCLENPLGAVRLTFEKAIASGSDPSSFNGKDWGATDLFRHFLLDEAQLSEVPFLNHETIRWVLPNRLVRFRGMVQDMLGNEFYVGAYKDGSLWRTNKFTDISQFPMESSLEKHIWERRLLYCIPVPGLNSWAESTSEKSTSATSVCRGMDWNSPQRDKRQRMDIEDCDHKDIHVSGDEVEDSRQTKKMREEGLPSSSLSNSKAEHACSTRIMLPEVDTRSLPCLVKIYDSPEAELKLNDVFEFVGVLTFDSEPPTEKDEDDFSDGLCDDMPVNFPPSKVPRLHCIVHRKLGICDFLPNSPITEPKPQMVKDLRESLLRHLTAVLGNDNLAAHYTLLHLLSKVQNRAENMAVGKLSLNLTRFSKDTASVFGTQLNGAFQNLLPFSNCIPLTIEFLNKASLGPRKDYQTNRLVHGALQLAEGSHLIIDELKLEAGTLNSVGVENVRLLKDLTQFQKVEYDFQYYKMEMTSDVQLLILSDGKSNILPADVVMPFQPSSVGSPEVVVAEVLEAWRWYLATVRSYPHSIELEMQKVLQDDLVAARQADRTLGSEDLSRWLTMGRLISASFGERSLSLEHWQMVKELERLRMERLITPVQTTTSTVSTLN